MSLQEWRQAIITPPAYRFGNSKLRFQTKYVLLLLVLSVVGVMYFILPSPSRKAGDVGHELEPIKLKPDVVSNNFGVGGKKASFLFGRNNALLHYNDVYPLTKPVSTERGLRFNIAIIADLDQDSKTNGGRWVSYFRRGYLFLQFNEALPAHSKVVVEWESGEPRTIKSGLSMDGRGMELSELVAFNGKLYSCDDRTGVIFELPYDDSTSEIQPIPWVILADGNGTSPKGFKCEWATVKDEHLWIGGLGKEWTNADGEFVNDNPQFVKKISPSGEVAHLNWRVNYQKISSEMGIHFPGYVIHESGGWSKALNSWMFLPRRASKEKYNDKTDERKGTNMLVLANDDFSTIKVSTVGQIEPTHGFSSFKWIPGTQDKLIVALKSEEVEGKTASFIMVFDTEGNILLPETKVGDHKYEGIEFI